MKTTLECIGTLVTIHSRRDTSLLKVIFDIPLDTVGYIHINTVLHTPQSTTPYSTALHTPQLRAPHASQLSPSFTHLTTQPCAPHTSPLTAHSTHLTAQHRGPHTSIPTPCSTHLNSHSVLHTPHCSTPHSTRPLPTPHCTPQLPIRAPHNITFHTSILSVWSICSVTLLLLSTTSVTEYTGLSS